MLHFRFCYLRVLDEKENPHHTSPQAYRESDVEMGVITYHSEPTVGPLPLTNAGTAFANLCVCPVDVAAPRTGNL